MEGLKKGLARPSSWTLQVGPAAGNQDTDLVKSREEPGLAVPSLERQGTG